MAIEMTCKGCGQAFTPSRAEILQGPVIYRLCPECREPRDEDAIDEPAAA